MKLVVKLGGSLLECPAERARLAEELAAIARHHQMVIVHGGGKQMSQFLAERGIESRFVDGLRVTSPEVVDAVLKVFAGTVNHELVASFVAAGAKAVGLSGIDAALAEAECLRQDLGAVGKIVRTNAELLTLLCSHDYLPVVACVAGNREGKIFNVNADQMAVACAAGFRADLLVFLTDVEGVRGPEGVISELTPAACQHLIQAGVATGGMQAKLNAACDGLAWGIGQVIIVPGARPGVVSSILRGEQTGTRLVRENAIHG
ncbi:MAG: acetylglutamate kinase [Bryobacteraceae bacterium]|nr:acetylglutamate kinase [Bryobacteraceae bacterium]MDW8379741.1 acetylglutamate kinase [Bryobacterales bacterium]